MNLLQAQEEKEKKGGGETNPEAFSLLVRWPIGVPGLLASTSRSAGCRILSTPGLEMLPLTEGRANRRDSVVSSGCESSAQTKSRKAPCAETLRKEKPGKERWEWVSGGALHTHWPLSKLGRLRLINSPNEISPTR